MRLWWEFAINLISSDRLNRTSAFSACFGLHANSSVILFLLSLMSVSRLTRLMATALF